MELDESKYLYLLFLLPILLLLFLYNQYWKIRKGLFPTIGAIRKIGTTVIIEDITFPVPRLAAGTLDLQALFKA